ncbi:hypothetical protein M0Q28_06505 [Patescibacteria group bacterium]|jgi:hypothetical protein|nr:hypothetical protein [Patescibacteria group bacterium]
MNWNEFKERLMKSHLGDMEAQERINQAVRTLRDGLQTLGRLGHHFHLAEGTSANVAESENNPNGGSTLPAGGETESHAAPSLPVANSSLPKSPAAPSRAVIKKVAHRTTKTLEKKNG